MAAQPSDQIRFEYLLRLGDNALILGHRLGEWCGHGPILEQDIAVTNLALDFVGQSRNWLSYAGEVEGKGRDEDALAYLRDVRAYRNLLLLEQPNGDWAHTIVRQFLFDAFNYFLHQELSESKDEQIAAIASKSLKEVSYHLRYSSEWTIRLGDGTDESHQRMQTALNDLWPYTGELLQADDVDRAMAEAGHGANLELIAPRYHEKVQDILQQANLKQPNIPFMQEGGKTGLHTEHLGFILAELQFVQRAYPGQKW